MACYYCRLENRNIPDAGTCDKCNINACGPRDLTHGEICTHCIIFLCYRHQHIHASSNRVDVFASFPKTYAASQKIVISFLKNPTFGTSTIAIDHGYYMSKKLNDPVMAREFRDVKDLVKSIAANTGPLLPLYTRRLVRTGEYRRTDPRLSTNSALSRKRKRLLKMLDARTKSRRIITHKTRSVVQRKTPSKKGRKAVPRRPSHPAR